MAKLMQIEEDGQHQSASPGNKEPMWEFYSIAICNKQVADTLQLWYHENQELSKQCDCFDSNTLI